MSGRRGPYRQDAPAGQAPPRRSVCRLARRAPGRPVLAIAPREKKTIPIEVNGDSKQEADETFYLDLFGNSGSSLFTRDRGSGTILNDD
jgi:hypothetical protein